MLQSYDPRNADIKIWISGKLVHRDAAAISPFDSAVQNGDAVWEGLRLYKGRIFRLDQHLERLMGSAKALSYTDIPDKAALIDALKATLIANDMHDDVHVRLTLSRGVKYTSGMDPRLNTKGSTLIVIAEYKPPVYKTDGVRLITSNTRRIPEQCLDQKIHSSNQLNSILAKIEANAAGADDAMMLDVDGNIAETNATHLFFVFNGVVTTPTTIACPEGVTRATVLELAESLGIPSEIRHIARSEADTADEIFSTGTMGEIVPVVELDGRPVGGNSAGEITQQIMSAFRALTEREGMRVADAGA